MEEVANEDPQVQHVTIFSITDAKNFGKHMKEETKKENEKINMSIKNSDALKQDQEERKVKRKYKEIKLNPNVTTGIEVSNNFLISRNSQIEKNLCKTIDNNAKKPLKRKNFKSFSNSEEIYTFKINLVRERLLSDLKCQYNEKL